MTNVERADRLLREASVIGSELPGLLGKGSWNLAIRRAQEVVELVLKALLAAMGVEYPKAHDVAELFARTVHARGVTVDDETLAWVKEASRELARKRAPAFYAEEQYGEVEAREAAAAAERVLTLGTSLMEDLGGRS